MLVLVDYTTNPAPSRTQPSRTQPSRTQPSQTPPEAPASRFIVNHPDRQNQQQTSGRYVEAPSVRPDEYTRPRRRSGRTPSMTGIASRGSTYPQARRTIASTLTTHRTDPEKSGERSPGHQRKSPAVHGGPRTSNELRDGLPEPPPCSDALIAE